MRKYVLSIGLCTFLSISCMTLSPVNGMDNKEEKDYVVVTEDRAQDVIDESHLLSGDNADIVNDNMISAVLTESQAYSIESMDEVSYVEEDITLTGSTDTVETEDKGNDRFWNTKMINTYGEQSDNKVKVALLDSGIDDMLQDDVEVKERRDFIHDEHAFGLEDATGHGTAIASLLVGDNDNVRGINKNIELYSGRILDNNLETSLSRVIEAVNWAMEKDVDIISLSLGTQTYSKALEDIINKAHDKGILIIAASGNNGGQADYPARLDDVLSVGAVAANGEESSFSNESDVLAPGEAVRCNGPLGSTIVMSGTSIAVPHVVGAASLIMSEDESKSNDEVRNLIVGTTHNEVIDYSNAIENIDNDDIEAIKNKDKLNTYENDSDIKLSGSWFQDDHKSFTYSHGVTVHDNALKYMKDGAIKSDNSENTKGMDAHPQLHGYFHAVKDGCRDVNILACYRMIIKIGNQYGKGKNYSSISSSDYAAVNSKDKSAIITAFSEYKDDLSKLSKNEYKKAYVFGIALHTATDYIAHSSFSCSGDATKKTNWKRIKHSDAKDSMKYCDNPKVKPNRYTLATRIGRNVVNRYNGDRSSVSVAHDFHYAGGGFYKDDSNGDDFRLANITYYYAKVCDALGSDREPNVKKHYEQINITIDSDSSETVLRVSPWS